MSTLFIILLVASGLTLIVSVLMHSGKSAGLSGSIAGGAEQLFGKEKAKGYDKLFDSLTKFSAAAFLISALVVTILQ